MIEPSINVFTVPEILTWCCARLVDDYLVSFDSQWYWGKDEHSRITYRKG